VHQTQSWELTSLQQSNQLFWKEWNDTKFRKSMYTSPRGQISLPSDQVECFWKHWNANRSGHAQPHSAATLFGTSVYVTASTKHSNVSIMGSAANHVVKSCSCLLFSVCNVSYSSNVVAAKLVTVFVIETWILWVATTTYVRYFQGSRFDSDRRCQTIR